MNNNVTLVIQGELKPTVIDMVKNNIDKYKIILVTNSKKTEILDELYNIDNLVINKYKEDKRIMTDYNFYYQIYSTYLGLCNVTTEYAIKIRGDEYFENLEPLIECMMNTDKVVVSNFGFMKTCLHKYNVCDHLIGCKTDILYRAFNALVKIWETNKVVDGYSELFNNRVNNPEKRIAVALLITMGVPINSFNNVRVGNIINKHFHLFDSNKFGKFIYSNNSGKLSAFKKEFHNEILSCEEARKYSISLNDDIHRMCDIDKCDDNIVFLFGDNSIFNQRFQSILNIINSFNNEEIIIYSNDNTNFSSLLKNNIKILDYKTFDVNRSSKILFVINNSAIHIIYNNFIKANNVFLLTDEIFDIPENDYITLLLEYVDYLVCFNNVCLTGDLINVIKERYINIENIKDHIDVKKDDIDINMIL